MWYATFISCLLISFVVVECVPAKFASDNHQFSRQFPRYRYHGRRGSSLDAIGGSNLIGKRSFNFPDNDNLNGRSLDSIGGNSLIGRSLDKIGGSSLIGRSLDGIGGSNLIGRSLDSIGGNSLLGRSLDRIGGSSLIGRSLDKIGGSRLIGRNLENLMYYPESNEEEENTAQE